MQSNIAFLFTLFFPGLAIAVKPLSEQDIFLAGLENRYEIRIIRLENSISKLENIETVKANWLPQLSVAAKFLYMPYDTMSRTSTNSLGVRNHNDSVMASVFQGESLSVAQSVPGGGVFDGDLVLKNSRFLTGRDSTFRPLSLSLSFTQPLLRDAWGFGEVTQKVKLARIDNEKFSLEQKKRLLSFGSDIRIRFWKLFEAQSLVSLYTREMTFATERMSIERTRFSIGLATSLDTLNCSLDLINASARLHDAQSNQLQAREELSFYSGLPKENVLVDTTITPSIQSFPSPDDFIQQVEKFDPQLHIFDVMAKRLQSVRAQTKNSLLPHVDLKTSWEFQNNETKASGSEEMLFNNSIIGLIVSYAFPTKQRRIALADNTLLMEKNNLDRVQYKEQLRLKISELGRSWEREQQAIEIACKALQIAEQALDVTRQKFSAGTADRLALDKADNDYRSACVNLLQKQLLMKQLEIIIDEMTGSNFSRFGVEIK